MPANPNTFAISWGSQIALVVPRGRTARSNSAGVDLPAAAVAVVGADDPVAADRDVAFVQRAGRDIQNASAFDHEVGGLAPERLIDPAAELGPGRRHAYVSDPVMGHILAGRGCRGQAGAETCTAAGRFLW